MFIGFEDIWTEFTVCLIARADVFVAEVRSGVEAPKEEQPAEELHFARKFRGPDPSGIRVLFIFGME